MIAFPTDPASLDTKPGTLQVVRPRWDGAILFCGKCAKKHGDGKAIRRALKDGAGPHLAAATSNSAASKLEPSNPATGKRALGKRKVKVIKTACLGLCPKHAVIVASAATLAAGEVLLLRGTCDVAGALPRLLPPAVIR